MMTTSLNLLLIEDDPLDADLSITHIEAEGYTCEWQRVQTKKDLLAALKKDRFDLILIDYNLPGFDGLTALGLIKELGVDTPIIFVTGNLQAELAIDSIKAGALDFVHKDRLTRLGSSVKRALDEVALKRDDKLKNAELKLFRKLNEGANRGAGLDELANILITFLPELLVSNEVVVYLRSLENNSLVVYNLHPFFERLRKLEQPIKFDVQHLEIPLTEQNFYTDCVRDQEVKVLDSSDALEDLFRFYADAVIPGSLKEIVAGFMPTIVKAINIRKIAMIPMVSGTDVIGFLGLLYQDPEEGQTDIKRISTMIDQITAIFARKLLEEEVGKLHDRQKMILDSAAEGIMGMDMEGRHIFVNPAAAAMLGYEAHELLGQQNHILYHASDRKADSFDKNTCVIYKPTNSSEASKRENETVFVRKDGSSFPASYTSSKIMQEGNEVGVVVAFRDISEQVENTRALARLGQVVEQVQVSVGITDLAGELVYVNPYFEKVSGYSRNELEGSNSRLLKSGYQDDALYKNMWATITAGHTWQGRLVNRSKLGEIYYEDAVIFPVKTDDGEIINYATVKREISAEVRAQQKIQRQLSHLEALHLIDATILSSMDLSLTLDVVLGEAVKELDLDAIDLLAYDAGQQSFSCLSRQGFNTHALEFTNLSLGEGLAGQAALTRELVHVDDLAMLKEKAPQLVEEGFISYYGVPLVARGELKGVIEIFFRREFEANNEWMGFLNAIAGQAAIAIENAQLFADLRQKNTDLTFAYEATLEGWVRGLEIHDMETEGHSRRVVQMVVQLARSMGVEGEMLEHIRRGALLHDIGKLGVEKSILNKPGPLTPEEREAMQKHTVYGYEMLADIPYLQPALDIPYSHHERWDGTGYPRGLKGAEIPLSARIFAIVDVYDALIYNRPYRKAWGQEEVLDHLQDASGKHFDPDVVSAFFDEFVFDKKTK